VGIKSNEKIGGIQRWGSRHSIVKFFYSTPAPAPLGKIFSKKNIRAFAGSGPIEWRGSPCPKNFCRKVVDFFRNGHFRISRRKANFSLVFQKRKYGMGFPQKWATFHPLTTFIYDRSFHGFQISPSGLSAASRPLQLVGLRQQYQHEAHSFLDPISFRATLLNKKPIFGDFLNEVGYLLEKRMVYRIYRIIILEVPIYSAKVPITSKKVPTTYITKKVPLTF